MTDVAESRTGWWSALPRWARVGLIAFVAIVVALAALVLVRVLTRTPAIPLGVTAVSDLRPGSCLAEDGLDRAEYTVVPCATEHPQQVFATAELELDESVYGLVDDALTRFGDEVCARYLEYRLFLVPELEKGDYLAHALDVPDPDAYAAGDTDALCVIVPEAEGATLTGDLYRAMP